MGVKIDPEDVLELNASNILERHLMMPACIKFQTGILLHYSSRFAYDFYSILILI